MSQVSRRKYLILSLITQLKPSGSLKSENFIPYESRSEKESSELLEDNIGEGCDANTEITKESKESLVSYSIDGETYKWSPMNLLESGCHSCEIPLDENGQCKCPKHPCPNTCGFYVRI